MVFYVDFQDKSVKFERRKPINYIITMYGKFQKFLQDELKAIDEAGLYKRERNIASPQSAEITLQDGSKALNFCANNYLGLADDKRLAEAAKMAMDARGYGMSSVRFICGTQDIHKDLEKAIAEYFHTEDAILYAACFDHHLRLA